MNPKASAICVVPLVRGLPLLLELLPQFAGLRVTTPATIFLKLEVRQ